MDPQTPAPKFVRWAFDVASPSGHSAAGTPSSPESVSSSIVFVNSQLVAHGFLRSPGIADSIERLDHDDQEAIVKCLLGMLSQRMEDMSRTEDLNTKLRTLSYDHERLNGMHKLAKEQATHAECEAEAAKSKLNATLTQLATLQASQKQTTALLSKSQSALRDTRIAAQNEIKRKEKEVERVMERWGKISNDQAKVNGVSSGLTCANLITDPAIVGPRANPALEASLAHLESERSQLTQENDMFRQILLSLANGLQSTHYALTSAGADSSSYIPEPAPITQTALFTPSITQSLADPETHALNAHKKLKELLIGVREWAEKENQAQNNNAKGKGKAVEGQEESEKKSGADEVVIERLRDEIKTLKTELEESKAAAILQSQNLIDQFANDTRFIRGSAEAGGSTDPDDMSVDAVSPGEIENLTAQIAEQQRVLDSERARFTEATIKLGRERAEIEAERLKFSEEKRAWALEKMLASMPETPQPETDHPAPSPRTKGEKPRKSGSGKTPRKSKIHPLKTRARASRKSDIATVEEEEEEEIIVPVSGSKLFQPSRIGTGSSIFPSVSAASSSLSVPLTVPVPAPVKSSASSISSNPFDQLLARSAEAAQSMPVIIPPPTAGSAPVSSTTPTITPPPTLAPPKVDPAPPKPIPKTPQPPSRTQQFMKKNSYAPAVPSPLSRILNIAGSPVDPDSSSESIEEQAAPPPPPPPTALPVRRPTTSRDNVSKAAATKSSATGHGSRVVGGTIRSSSSITAKQQAAGTSKIKAKPKPTRVPVGGPGKATSTIPGARVTRRSK